MRPHQVAFNAGVEKAERFSQGEFDWSPSDSINFLPLLMSGPFGTLSESGLNALHVTHSVQNGDLDIAREVAARLAQVAYASLSGDYEFFNRIERTLIVHDTQEEAIASIAAAATSSSPKLNRPHRFDILSMREIRHDYEVLSHVSVGHIGDTSFVVPPHIYSLYSDFWLGGEVARITPSIDTTALRYFRQHPNDLLSIAPRQFEEIIAGLMEQFGFEVELTARTADGGRDIIATANRTLNLRCLIECKRYASDNRVGLALVQRLHGVVQSEQATKGILVTTSSFTKPARDFLRRQPWLLEGRDFAGIVEWLDDYQRFRMAQAADRQYAVFEMLKRFQPKE
jgi:hypothetical protein